MTQIDPSHAPETTADALRDFCEALLAIYLELNWPFWVLWMRLLGREPDRAEFEQAVRADLFGMPVVEPDAGEALEDEGEEEPGA